MSAAASPIPAVRLVLVDDNPQFLETIADVLRLNYCIVGTLSSGAAALAQIPALNPDIAILGISLLETHQVSTWCGDSGEADARRKSYS